MKTRDDIEIPLSGLIDASLAAKVAGVKVGTIRQWKNRGHLRYACDTDGYAFRDAQGHLLFDFMDVINVEYKLRERARREPLRFAAA